MTSATGHRYADYERSGFQAEIDPHSLIHAPGVQPATSWRIMVDVQAADRRAGPLREPYRGGSAGRPSSGLVSAHKVVPAYGPTNDLRILVRPVRCVVESAEIADRALSVSVRGLAGFEPHEIEVTLPGGSGSVRHPLDRLADKLATRAIPLPRPVWSDDGGTGPEEGSATRIGSGLLRAAFASSRRPVRASPPQSTTQPCSIIRRVAVCTSNEPASAISASSTSDAPYGVRQLEVLPDHRIVVTGSLAGLADFPAQYRSGTPATSASARAESTRRHRFHGNGGAGPRPLGLGRRPLPSGDYALGSSRPHHQQPQRFG